MIVPIALSLIMGLAILISENISITYFKYRKYLVSLIAGISVTYIFLHLLPELYIGVSTFNKSLLIFVLLGFVTFHVIEKYIFQNVNKKRITTTLKLNHALGTFLYDGSVGIVIVYFLSKSFSDGLLFFIPVFLYASLSNLSIRNVHSLKNSPEQPIRDKVTKIALAGATFYGVLLALILPFSLKFIYSLTGIVAGVLFYIVIRETIPKEKEGKPLFFIIGVLIYSLLIFTVWTLL